MFGGSFPDVVFARWLAKIDDLEQFWQLETKDSKTNGISTSWLQLEDSWTLNLNNRRCFPHLCSSQNSKWTCMRFGLLEFTLNTKKMGPCSTQWLIALRFSNTIHGSQIIQGALPDIYLIMCSSSGCLWSEYLPQRVVCNLKFATDFVTRCLVSFHVMWTFI